MKKYQHYIDVLGAVLPTPRDKMTKYNQYAFAKLY